MTTIPETEDAVEDNLTGEDILYAFRHAAALITRAAYTSRSARRKGDLRAAEKYAQGHR